MHPDLLARLVGVERTMEPSLIARLAGVARTVNALASVRPVTPTLSHLEFGQVVRAQVAARFADGSFRVEIDDTALKLTLPSGTKPGDVLALRFVGREPQLQFELHVPSTEANPRVSSAGRLIGQLLSEPAVLAPRQAQPVVATPTTEPAQLREPLERAVERSGLFYEAHQARWIRGDYPLERLRQEPQSALLKDRQVAEHAHVQDKTQGAAHVPGRAPTDESAELQHLNRPGRIAAERSEGEDRTNSLVAREALPIVRQQLDTLETRHFAWQGEIWPGQLMHWQIAEQEPDAEHPESERDWLTQLSLSLPALGEIGAELGFSAQGVGISLTAKDSTVAAVMRAAAPELVHALEAAGLGAIVLKVRHGEPSP
jgi:hypothetical protein